jgi:hypothetical protein
MNIENNQKIEVTWYHAMRIWWSITWQSLLYGGLFSFIFSLVIFQIAMIFRLSVSSNFLTLFRIVMIFISQIIVLKMVLSQKYKKFRITIFSN